MVRRGGRTSKHESSHRFFKVMFGKNHSKFLHLPPEIEQRVKHLTNQDTELEDSCGQLWPVTLSLVDGSLAFQMGWEKFYVGHGLKEGQLLVFKYKEGQFTVRIFGTSACERTNFNNEMPGRRKKRKRCQGTTSEDEAHQTAGVKSDISISASGDESQNRITKLAVDLSFEMENGTFDAKKAEGAVIKLLDASTETEQRDVFDNASDKGLSLLSSNWVLEPTNPAGRDEDAQMGVIEIDLITRTTGDDAMEQTKTTAEDAQMGVIETDLITSTTGDDAMEQTKTTAEDAQMGANKTNLITSNTGDISIDKFVTALDAKTAISHTEITDQIRKKVGGTQMAHHSHQAGGRSGDAFMKRFNHEKPSDDNKMKKIMLKNEPFSLSPSIGGGKIPEGGHVAKSKFGDSVSSATFENPLGLCAIKKEVKMEDTANVFRQGSCGGKELPPVCNQPQMISPVVVKVEPDLPYETGILDTISSSIRPFSAEVESQSLLVVPQSIGRRLRGQTVRGATVVFLRDSVRRLWPVVYRENAGRRALTINWTEFCEQDNVKPGDKCEFQVENDTLFVYRVDVARGSS